MHLHTPLPITTATASPFAVIGTNVQATAEIAMKGIGFFMASPRPVNTCGCRLAELYASTEKFILRLFVSLLSH